MEGFVKKSGLFLTILFVVSVVLVGCATNQTGSASSNSDNPDAKRARAHTELGAAYFQQNNMEIALEEFNEAIKVDASYSLAYNGLGLVYAALGQVAEADANFKKSIQLEPSNSESHNNYGSFLCGRQRYDESIKQFLEAVKNPLYSTPTVAFTNAGICSLRKNDIKSAEIYLQRALQLDPLNHTAALSLAQIQFNRGDVQGANNALQNALIVAQSPDVLWLGIKIARKLGDKDAESSYALALRKQYPNSEQTKLLLNGQ